MVLKCMHIMHMHIELRSHLLQQGKQSRKEAHKGMTAALGRQGEIMSYRKDYCRDDVFSSCHELPRLKLCTCAEVQLSRCCLYRGGHNLDSD